MKKIFIFCLALSLLGCDKKQTTIEKDDVKRCWELVGSVEMVCDGCESWGLTWSDLFEVEDMERRFNGNVGSDTFRIYSTSGAADYVLSVAVEFAGSKSGDVRMLNRKFSKRDLNLPCSECEKYARFLILNDNSIDIDIIYK